MAEEKDKKNKFQQRMDEQAAAVEKAYAELREVYDDPTDEQILAVAGDNLRGYQRKIGNTAGNWGTALGSNAVWGTLNKNTRNALEAGYQSGLEETKKSTPDKRAEVKFALGDGEGAKKVTRGMQIDARNWGDNITDVENITPEQVRRLNEIMSSGGFTNFAIPTKQVTTKNENGKDVTTDVEQNISLYDLLESATPEEIEALEYLGFIDEDGAYIRPHNETFDEKLARKERERERIDLLAQQRALDRQRARTGLADLAAGIGDMIKASNGAIVTPRDYKAMYDSLTEQQKTNYNNYLARMQAMKEAEKAKAKEAADRAYQEKLLAEQRAYQMAQDKAQRDWQAGEYKKNRDAELAASAIKAQADYLGKENKKISTSFAGNTYTFNSKDQSLQTFNEIFGLIAPKITTKDGVIAPPYGSLLEFDEDGKATKTSLAAIASAAIHSDAVMNDPNLVRKIKDKLNSASYDVEGTGKYGVIAGEEVTESATPYYDLLTKGGSTFNAGASTEATTNTKLKNPFAGQF